MEIKIAHSPDSDDAFMFYALQKAKLGTHNYQIKIEQADIQTLNQKAQQEAYYDISAVSYHAYAFLDQDYCLMQAGSSFGDNYGPALICLQNQQDSNLLERIKAGEVEVLIPGEHTSAALTLKLYAPRVQTKVLPFKEIQPALLNGQFQAGLIIHEGQVNYAEAGFSSLLNLGEWWYQRTSGLPLPLGANIIKRTLAAEHQNKLASLVRDSIEYALQNREEALNYALQFDPSIPAEQADRFIGMYVNELTLDLGSRGKQSIELFFKEAYQLGLISKMPKLDFIN